jgi:hypothetical protein
MANMRERERARDFVCRAATENIMVSCQKKPRPKPTANRKAANIRREIKSDIDLASQVLHKVMGLHLDSSPDRVVWHASRRASN